jgi:hypothetical protein
MAVNAHHAPVQGGLSCEHVWDGPATGKQQCVRCGATCQRDARGKIESYTTAAMVNLKARRAA